MNIILEANISVSKVILCSLAWPETFHTGIYQKSGTMLIVSHISKSLACRHTAYHYTYVCTFVQVLMNHSTKIVR